MSQMFSYNVLVTLDRNYLSVLTTMLYSLSQSDPNGVFTVYVAHDSLTDEDFLRLNTVIPRTEFVDVRVPQERLSGAPISDRYPPEMYYRLFAAQYLPEQLDRILYLDPDLVVLHSLRELYQIDFGTCLFAAASHIESNSFRRFNQSRLHLGEQDRYINSGVMMMNLKLLRVEQDPQQIFRFIQQHRRTLLLPDQDILNTLYAGRIRFLDPLIYNLGDKYLRLHNLHQPRGKKLDLDWVRQHTAIVHFYGRNKPWKDGYRGRLGRLYQEAAASVPSQEQA